MITRPTSLSKSSFSANSSSDNCSASSILACSSLRTRSASEPRSGFFGTWTQTKCQVYTTTGAASVLYPQGSTNLLRAMSILQDYTVYMHQDCKFYKDVSFTQECIIYAGLCPFYRKMLYRPYPFVCRTASIYTGLCPVYRTASS